MVSGVSFVRNGVMYDYPFVESISSILPLCDECVIAVGDSTDDTRARIEEIHSPTIRIIDTTWDERLREGGRVLAHQTNVALQHIKGDWGFYLQGDEIIHEDDLPTIAKAMEEYQDNPRVEGFLFRYLHFYGSYRYVGHSRQWYRREVRIVRNRIGIESWGDAQGFRRHGRKLKVKAIDATIYHYGWVKPPAVQQLKQLSFNRLWHDDEWVRKNVGAAPAYDYSRGGRLRQFEGTHPALMHDRVASQDWSFEYDERKAQGRVKDRILDWIEEITDWRIGEYRNYELI